MKTCRRGFNGVRVAVLTVILIITVYCSFSYLFVPADRVYEPVDVTVNQRGMFVSLSAAPSYKIYYTTDGSVPTRQSKRYILPFSIKRVNVLCQHSEEISIGGFQIYDAEVPAANVIRAVAVAPDGTQGDITTTTCFEQTEDIAVVSIIADYDDLLDYDTGIMVKGRVFDEWISSQEAVSIVENEQNWQYQGNFSQKGRSWERPAIIEFYCDGEKIQIPAGIRIHGGMSRMYSQRGFNLYFRQDYGADSLEADLFGNGVLRYESLTLRNGGNAADSLKFKDSWIQGRLNEMNFSVLSSRPALVYINGEYWGIYILQEKYSDAYVAEHFDVQDIIMIKEGEIEEGDDIDLYEEFLSFAEKDFRDPEVWSSFKEIVDIKSMADYFAAEIYIGNADWAPDKNIALWRTVEKGQGFGDGRWRYMMYDTEYSSSLYNREKSSAEFDHLARTESLFPIFANAMEIEEFRRLFASSMERVMSRFQPDDVKESLERVWLEWMQYVEDNSARFGGDMDLYDVEPMIDYFEDRYFMSE